MVPSRPELLESLSLDLVREVSGLTRKVVPHVVGVLDNSMEAVGMLQADKHYKAGRLEVDKHHKVVVHHTEVSTLRQAVSVRRTFHTASSSDDVDVWLALHNSALGLHTGYAVVRTACCTGGYDWRCMSSLA